MMITTIYLALRFMIIRIQYLYHSSIPIPILLAFAFTLTIYERKARSIFYHYSFFNCNLKYFVHHIDTKNTYLPSPFSAIAVWRLR